MKNKDRTVGTVSPIIKHRDSLSSDLVQDFRGFIKDYGDKERNEAEFNKEKKYLWRTGYTDFAYGYYKGKYVFVAGNPKHFFNPLPAYKLTLHLSQWQDVGMRGVANFIANATGVENTKTIFSVGALARLDLWLDLELQYEDSRMTVFRPGIRNYECYRSGMRTYNLGDKSNKCFMFYEKAIKDRDDLDFKFKKNRSYVNGTRFELKFSGRDVPIRHLSEYSKTADLDLFSIVKTSYLPLKARIALKSDPRLKLFMHVLETEGLQQARRVTNKNRNFYRTIQPILEANGLDLNLNSRWKKKVSRFVGDFDISQL